MKEKEEERLINLKQIEKNFHEKGIKYIAGIDEAGRGPLAGPVVVASVIMPEGSMIEGVNDSKKVSEKKREKLYDLILKEAVSYGIGIIYQDEIDKINILQATKKGLTEAVEQMDIKPDLIMVDALTRHFRNTLSFYYKRRCKMLLNFGSINNCKSYKGQNYERMGQSLS